jgi:hypothetical protein
MLLGTHAIISIASKTLLCDIMNSQIGNNGDLKPFAIPTN